MISKLPALNQTSSFKRIVRNALFAFLNPWQILKEAEASVPVNWGQGASRLAIAGVDFSCNLQGFFPSCGARSHVSNLDLLAF